ncbi:g2861 [Coccomyxa viridis]|uniref:G2861 protein n=1 Tax=Coccomyxa viridis TaxID=1274662 RepID=A0ABP1FLF3_9CHLO
MFSSEKEPLKSSTDAKAKKALNDLSASIGDEENPYLAAKAPMAGGPPTMGQRFWKELRQNWWLWGSVVFAILLVGGLLLFRNQLYDSASHGLPFLAVKENAAEACTTACQDEQSAGMALATGQGGDKDANNARLKEAFESCYTKCVAQETKDVAEERQKFKKTEEDFEKMVEGQVVQPGV